MQCSCNTLLAVCRAQFRKVSLWNSFDLDFVLNLRDNLFKSFGLHQFLDASDLPEHVSFHGNSWTRNKTYLHGAEAIICTRFFFSPFLPCSRNAASLFIKSTVTAIISYSRSYYLFDSHSRDSRGFAVSSGTSVLLKFSCLQQVENYIEVIHPEYQGRVRERQFFQLQFLEIEAGNLDESCQNIKRVMQQICRNSAYSKRKEEVTGLQREPQKILKTKKHGDVKINIKVGTKVKQLMTSETQKLKTDVDFQKESNIGVSSDVCKETLQSYSEKLKLPKMKKLRSNGQKEGTHSGKIVKKFKGMVHEDPFYVCQICHRCLYKRSVQNFERNIKN